MCVCVCIAEAGEVSEVLAAGRGEEREGDEGEEGRRVGGGERDEDGRGKGAGGCMGFASLRYGDCCACVQGQYC